MATIAIRAQPSGAAIPAKARGFTVSTTMPSSKMVATVENNAPDTQAGRRPGDWRARAPSAAIVPVLETNPDARPESASPTLAPAARRAT